ncbi:MAG: hypothetical protein ACKVI3_01070, partial [Verrucomicrobiia bacterium]
MNYPSFIRILCLLTATTLSLTTIHADMDDPYLWLEKVESERALDWVKARNQIALDELTSTPSYT